MISLIKIIDRITLDCPNCDEKEYQSVILIFMSSLFSLKDQVKYLGRSYWLG